MRCEGVSLSSYTRRPLRRLLLLNVLAVHPTKHDSPMAGGVALQTGGSIGRKQIAMATRLTIHIDHVLEQRCYARRRAVRLQRRLQRRRRE
jgi:hypothetical protein